MWNIILGQNTKQQCYLPKGMIFIVTQNISYQSPYKSREQLHLQNKQITYLWWLSKGQGNTGHIILKFSHAFTEFKRKHKSGRREKKTRVREQNAFSGTEPIVMLIVLPRENWLLFAGLRMQQSPWPWQRQGFLESSFRNLQGSQAPGLPDPSSLTPAPCGEAHMWSAKLFFSLRSLQSAFSAPTLTASRQRLCLIPWQFPVCLLYLFLFYLF